MTKIVRQPDPRHPPRKNRRHGAGARQPLCHRLRGFYQFWCMTSFDVFGWG
jgi:hypothetical protein